MAKILVIDDEDPIRKMLRKLLEKNGHDVMDACNGSQGIKLFKAHGPDIVITDLVMPEKEGMETIRELKKLNSDVRIIAISGGGITDPTIYLNLAAKLGATCTFAKPLDNNELISTVKRLLAQ